MKDSLLVRPRRGRRSTSASRRTRARTSGSSSAAASRRVGVQAESGMMGGKRVARLPRARQARARTRSSRARTATTRPISRSPSAFRDRLSSPSALDAPDEVETPGRGTLRGARRASLDRPRGDLEGDAGRDGRRHARARARPRRRPARARRSSRRRSARTSGPRPTRRSWPASARRAARSGRSASTGRSSPTRRCARASSSPARTATGWHLRGVEAGRDYQPRFADIREPKEGDACPNCGGALGFQTAIEVGHIFKLRHAATRSRSAPRTWTRTATRSRS